MFDIGFWELTVIGVIALMVVGPERLPAMARTLGLWVGRIRRYVSHVRDDIEREIQAEELRELMKDSGNLNSIGESLTEAGKALNEVKRDIESADLSSAGSGNDEAQAASQTASEIDDAATDVGKAVTGGDADAGAAAGEDEHTGSPDENIATDERRSG